MPNIGIGAEVSWNPKFSVPGNLAPGKVADFIVLNADPLADITNTRNIDAVWMNGEPVNRGALAPNPIPSQ